MKCLILLGILGIFFVSCYDRNAAVNYARTYWNSPNHRCGSYSSCTPYSYFGGEACGYGGQGGDCANFVSQCLLAGGHPALNGNSEWCRGYPCGKEEVGARKLGVCLSNYKGWRRSCGYLMGPPGDIQAGDVLIYHSGSCDNYSAHATIVISAGGGSAQIACHSNNKYGVSYTYMGTSMPYYEWLHKP